MESGRKKDGSELDAALQLARLTLCDAGVRFLACDMPEANDLTVGNVAMAAQQERETISLRTKEALAAAKASDAKLGNPNLPAALRRVGKGGEALRAVVADNANTLAGRMASVIDPVRAEGDTSLQAIAAKLTLKASERDAVGVGILLRQDPARANAKDPDKVVRTAILY